MPQSFTPATRVTFAVNHTHARAAFVFFIFGKIKSWAWSLYTITKTGLGSHFSIAWLISAWHCKEGRPAGGRVYFRFPVSAVAVQKPAKQVGLCCIKERAAARSISFLPDLDFSDFPRHFDQLLNAPHFFRLELLLFSPHRNSISSSTALTILQPVEGLQKKKKMSPKLTNGSLKRSLKYHISTVVCAPVLWLISSIRQRFEVDCIAARNLSTKEVGWW